MKIGFIGTGNMGLPMARNLIRAGHTVTVYNRTRERAEPLKADGARIAEHPEDLARNSEVVITMLSDDPAVEEIAFGSFNGGETRGIIDGLGRDATHISMSTISVALSKRLDEAHARAVQNFVSAPVFGRPEAAEAKKLWIVAAGADAQIEKCRPIFDALGRGASVVGRDPWLANVVKLTGNFMIASMLEAMGEGFALVRKYGVGMREFLDIINSALFNSPLYANYGSKVVDEAYEPAGFKLTLGLKDVRLALEAADQAGVPMPLAGILRDHFLEAIAHGYGERDWAGVASVSAHNAGLGGKHR